MSNELDTVLANLYSDRVDRLLDGGNLGTSEKAEVQSPRLSTNVRPDGRKFLWCPFCDEWKARDSMIARKRLGLHITEKHTDEVRFDAGVTPPELIDV